MNKLDTAKRVAIISALVEGNSLRSTTRMVGCSINTVTKLLVDAGEACARYQYENLRDLACRRIQPPFRTSRTEYLRISGPWFVQAS